MRVNVGGIDRIYRVVIGLVLIGLAATGTVGWWGWWGVAPLTTAAIGWCPAYTPFGASTCSTKTST